VILAADGATALEILRGDHATLRIGKPRLMLLDLNMPGMNGIELLRQLRADEALRGTVVFVLSTSDAENDLRMAYQQCIAGYLVKSALGPHLQGLARFLAEYGRASALPSQH